MDDGDVAVGGPLPKPVHMKPLTGLSPDVLYLLEKLPDGDIEGVVYKPSECTAIIQGPTPEAVDECVTKLQSAYQNAIASNQLKVEEVPHAVPLDPDRLLFVAAKLNARHNQCAFIYMEDKCAVKLISNSPRQFDAAKKELISYLDKMKSLKHKLPPLFAMKICGHRVLTLKQSDIVAEDVEVIVNAANKDLDHAGGVAWALNTASGGGLQKVSNAYIATHGPVQMGDVAVTGGGGALKCKHVYHVIGPKAEEYSPKDCRRLIEQVVEQVLITAEKNGIPSISFPAISSGIFGVAKELVAEVIINTIINHQFTSRPPVLGDIRIVINDSSTFECFAKYINQKKRGVTTSTPTAVDVVKRGSTGEGGVSTSAGAVGG